MLGGKLICPPHMNHFNLESDELIDIDDFMGAGWDYSSRASLPAMTTEIRDTIDSFRMDLFALKTQNDIFSYPA
jgi:hypothetical protein